MDFQHKIEHLKDKGRFRELKEVTSLEGKFIDIQKRRFVNFTSNDYLGIAQTPIDLERLDKDLHTYGNHLSSSRLVSGNSIMYTEIEARLCAYTGFEAALITNSGYDANLAVFNVLKDEDVMIFSDAMNHASIIDGIRLSQLDKKIYPHLDYDILEHKIKSEKPEKTKIIVTDTIFSTDGSMADLNRLKQIKQQHSNVFIIIDDSHGLGLALNEDYAEIDVLTSSLSKAVGAYGGVILSSKAFKVMLVNTGRPVIYASGLPTINLHIIRENVNRLIDNDTKCKQLLELSRYFNQEFSRYVDRNQNTDSPIKEIRFRDNQTASSAYQTLIDNGILVSYFRYPTVKHPALRISLNTFHNKADIDALLKIVRDVL
ncbi:aminotransferase class I/II-fold pyridoxal phosphate-dependent enzyme [Staphylococcus simulans]|uniref:aminotransferase class I/II-fold pyridoxal phosphate-dependent enzyme n=1 Tax=Staphylococcus simulans TaxID=1286 RepID=UPI003999579F